MLYASRRLRKVRRGIPLSPEEQTLRAAGPALAALCDVLRSNARGGRRSVLRLHRIWMDYPGDAVESSVARALEFGQSDLTAIERMVLKSLHGDFFRLPTPNPDDTHG